jgi:tRNA A37 threonylcarbamoyladenosine synthetase subunit TsaC/SUA5/YrdC
LDAPAIAIGAGVPPPDGTRNSPARVANTIVPSAPQLAPKLSVAATSQIGVGCPPAVATFSILLPAQKPIHAPSGEKNGDAEPSVPEWARRRRDRAVVHRAGSRHP